MAQHVNLTVAKFPTPLRTESISRRLWNGIDR
jgi:hypothetical protein